MNFKKFDTREAAESGSRLVLVDPVSGEPIRGDDGREAAVTVRGVASRIVQADIRRRNLVQMAEDDRLREEGKRRPEQSVEDVHEDLIQAALPMVMGFENVERDGVPLRPTPDDIRWFLDLTFPMMERVNAKWTMVNRPFAVQVAEHSGKQANFPNGGSKA